MYDKRIVENIDKMTFARVQLWDKLYCDDKCSRDFIDILDSHFNATIKQDNETMSYTFKSSNRLDMTLITEAVKVCIIEAIDKMYINKDISEEEYKVFKDVEDNLFAIAIQIGDEVHIKL